QGREQQQNEAANPSVQQIPGRLDVLKWPLIVGFLGIFALGAILLGRKPISVVISSGSVSDAKGFAASRREESSPPPALPRNDGKDSSPSSMSEVDAAVSVSLDALKDQIFRLELRRQAGTISETEYARERARAEKVLRDLVRG